VTEPSGSPVTLGPFFKLVFLTVAIFTFVSLAVDIGVVVAGSHSEASKNLLESCSTTYKMGFGAIIGLIGGKAL
jgi:hypothetical protein